MDRFDLFTFIHKGLRRVLFQTAQTIAATDFEDVGGGAAAGAAFAELAGFLDEHAHHEDEVVLPQVAVLAPELFIDLRADHAKLDGLQRELEGLFQRLGDSTACERASLGRRIEDRIGRLLAAHLLHMALEEADANRVLWAHRSDSELLDLQRRITASVAPERLAQWYALALPAANPRERRRVLGGLRASLAAADFELVTRPARAELGERSWSEALTTLVV